jgi:hypothetical protein
MNILRGDLREVDVVAVAVAIEVGVGKRDGWCMAWARL